METFSMPGSTAITSEGVVTTPLATIYRIPAINLEKLREGIAALDKRAHKLGSEPISFTITGWEEEEHTHPITGLAWTERFALVTVAGSAPHLNGWSFQAKLEPTEEGNLVKLMPGVGSIPLKFRTSKMICDHCETFRYRKEVFVVKHETTGQHMQVGRNCLADFLGGKDPEMLAFLLQDIATEMRGAGGYGYGIDPGEPTIAYVSTVAAFIRWEGYLSKAKAQFVGIPTASRAWMWLRPTSGADRKEVEELKAAGFDVEERDAEMARDALAWAANLDPEGSDYLHNLKVSSRLEYADHKTVGILSALIGSYCREQEREIKRKLLAQAALSNWVGEEGKRGSFGPLTITNVRTFDGQYGVRTLVSFIDGAGNQITWWTGYAPDWVKQGEEITVKGTVKKFDEYRGVKQTVLTRVAIS